MGQEFEDDQGNDLSELSRKYERFNLVPPGDDEDDNQNDEDLEGNQEDHDKDGAELGKSMMGQLRRKITNKVNQAFQKESQFG